MEEFRRRIPSLLFLTFSLIIIHAVHAANDMMNIGHNITDGETLVSSGGVFELRFWSPGNSSGNRYVAMSYTSGSFIVWILNRQDPVRNKAGVLKFVEPGILVLVDGSGGIVWSSSEPSGPLQNPVLQLLDSGNLVVRDADDDEREENFVWQSFDHPTDTYLPGMKLGWNLATNVETYLSSWTSNDDPSSGEYSLHVDPAGFPQIVVKKGEAVRYRAVPNISTLHISRNEVYYKDDDSINGSLLWRTRLSQNGISQRFVWNSVANDWISQRDTPSPGDACGASYNSPACGCLERFEPNGSNGCTRSTPLAECSATDVFLNYSGIKLPDTRNSVFHNLSVSIEACRDECLGNCTCTAYAELEVGRGCLFYFGDLIDIRYMSEGGRNLYIRMDSSEQEKAADESKGSKRVTLIVSLTTPAGVLLLLGFFILILYVWKRKHDPNLPIQGPYNVSQGKDLELPFFELSTILKATDHFSIDNRLGEGGFGPVYRGTLDDGEEIAVKRLSKTSSQGVDELKNEVILIAKLQHRNLVRLLGCCVEGEENMLIYEYMPNKSLNLILFDQTQRMLLDWQTRFNIVNGIAKGLLYLHQDSRLRIIHRDLKASNILLDSHMNPRISDFGLARSFGGNETEVKTHRVVGTYGYMSPEYAADGVFSVKSDVFSFGVLVLEVVSGTRNRGSSLGDHCLNLLGHAWKLESEGNPVELVDSVLGDAFDSCQAVRSIRVALLCVQKFPEDRPNMASVVFMLGNEIAVPEAKEPGYYTEREVFVANSSSSSKPTNSLNELTITCPRGR